MRYAISSKYLVTRQEGAEHRTKLELALQQVGPDEIVEISLEKVKAMTGSFTDEFLGKFLTSRRAGDVPGAAVVLTGLNAETAFEVELCLGRRNAVIVADVGGRLDLLGGDEFLKDTFAAAAGKGEFRALELATELDVTAPNINNRLKRLVDDGALIRLRKDPMGGGKQFLYRVPATV